MFNAPEVDKETRLAFLCALTAANIGWAVGCSPRDAAGLAAISSVASRLIADQINRGDRQQKRLGGAALATPLLFFAARGLGLKMSPETAFAALAGSCGAIYLCSEEIKSQNERQQLYSQVLLAAFVAAAAPHQFSSLANGLLVVSGIEVMANEARNQVNGSKRDLVELGRMAALAFLPAIVVFQ